MNNQMFNQQNQSYQPPVQPSQPQQSYQPPVQPQKPAKKLDLEKVLDFLPILAIIFAAIGATACLYYLVVAVADLIDGSAFSCLNDLAAMIGAVAKYAFFAVACIGLSKLLKK